MRKPETERLLLRRFCEADLQYLFEYLSDPDTVKYEPYYTFGKTKTVSPFGRTPMYIPF